MICGYLPFEDANTSILYKKIMSGEFKMPGFLSERSK
jgi:5'-AMP-activated protein kinase, catalytic alpha subunit